MRTQKRILKNSLISLIWLFFYISFIQAQTIDTVFNAYSSIQIIELLKNNPGEILILDEAIGVVKSLDFGQTWVSALYDTNAHELFDISFDQKNTKVGFSAAYGGLYKTIDGGYNWFNTNQFEFPYLVDVNPYSPNIIFVQKASCIGPICFNYLYSSTDNGETWEESSTQHTILDPQFHSSSDSIVYGFNRYDILRTINLGKSWKSIKATSSRFTALSVSKNNPEVLYAGEQDFLYKTTNGGNNWNEIGSKLRDLINSFEVNNILLDDSNSGRLFLGLSEGLFLTEDDGLHWRQINEDPVYLITADNDTPRNIYFIINNRKTAIRLVDTLTVTEIYQENVVQPKKYFLFQNNPNPFNPSTTINYQLKTISNVQLTIYDVSGRQIKTLLNTKQNAGQFSVTFNASGLASGIYIYRLKAGRFIQSRKMIHIK